MRQGVFDSCDLIDNLDFEKSFSSFQGYIDLNRYPHPLESDH